MPAATPSTGTLLVRPEAPGDEAAVHRVEALAFGHEAEADLVDALRAAGALTLSLVAVRRDEIVGHVAFSPVRVEAPSGPREAMGLAPLAVLPGEQRRGVGTALTRDGLDRLRTTGHTLVIVLGHPTYYPRLGFGRASCLGLRWEHPAPDEAFMALELEPGAAAGGGIVHLHPAFDGM
jgi:putative acetyltransferase